MKGKQPKVYIPSSDIVCITFYDGDVLHRRVPAGMPFSDKLSKGVKELEEMGYTSAKIIFRRNQH